MNISFLFLWKIYPMGKFLGLFLPSGLGGDVYRTWAQKETGAKIGKSAASVLFDQLTGLFALATIGAVGATFLVGKNAAILFLAGYAATVAMIIVTTGDGFFRRFPSFRSKDLNLPVRVLHSFDIYRNSPREIGRDVRSIRCFPD